MDEMKDPHQSRSVLAAELGIGAAAAVITAPYLSFVGAGNLDITQQLLALCNNSTALGTGLAGAINTGMAAIPGIGPALAAGGWVNAAASGILGIGGTLLGNYITKHYDRHGHLPWGKIIKYSAIATSILIALPSLLSGISMGLVYLTMLVGGATVASTVAASSLAGVLDTSLGFMGGINIATAGAGLAGLFSHFLTCGAALVPAVGMLLADRTDVQSHHAFSYEARLVSHEPCTKGHPCTLDFQLVDTATGRALDDSELTTVHTKKLHTMIVDSSLSDYHHLHPTYDQARKVFTCSFTPNLQATYAMWNDFTVAGDNHSTQLKTDITIAHARPLPANILPTNTAQAGALTFHLSPNGPLRAGQPSTLTVSITGPGGRTVTDLEPIMGSYAHLAGFSADGAHFIHSHPLGIQPDSEASRGFGQLQFHIEPGRPGMDKFFLQIQRGGRIVTVPFAQLVAPSPSFASRIENAAPGHSHMAMA